MRRTRTYFFFLLLIVTLTGYFKNALATGYGIKAVELDKNDFSKVGISIVNDKYELIAYKMAGPKSATSHKFIVDKALIGIANARNYDTNLTPQIIPWLIVAGDKENTAAYFNNPVDYWKTQGVAFTEKQFSEDINNWFAYHISARDASGNPYDIYLWYDEDPLNKSILQLPDDKGTLANQKKPLFEPLPVIQSLSVRPNPLLNGSGEFSFIMSKARAVDIKVYDVNGTEVAVIAQMQALDAGEFEYGLNLSSHAAGMYILAITTDQNESLISRFIIMKN